MSSWFDKLLEELQRRQAEQDARREGRPIPPTPDDPLEAGDELLFVASPDMGPQLEELLAPHAR